MITHIMLLMILIMIELLNDIKLRTRLQRQYDEMQEHLISQILQ